MTTEHQHQSTQDPSPESDASSVSCLGPAAGFEGTADDGKAHVLLLMSGSVAAIQVGPLIESLRTAGDVTGVDVEVRVVLSDKGAFFAKGPSARGFSTPAPPAPCYVDSDEWDEWRKLGDSVVHIELRRWAHVAVIAPTSANTLAALSVGLCTNLLTSVMRAWDTEKPVLVAPSMNTMMWDHPHTAKAIGVLTGELGMMIIPPVEKKLACNDVGVGALAPPLDIAQATLSAWSAWKSKQGARE